MVRKYIYNINLHRGVGWMGRGGGLSEDKWRVYKNFTLKVIRGGGLGLITKGVTAPRRLGRRIVRARFLYVLL